MKHNTQGLSGPLPEPAFPAMREGDMETACWEVDTYTAEQMRAAIDAAVAAAFSQPVAWQSREHGDDEWHNISRESFNVNPARYTYRELFAAPLAPR